MHTTAAAPLLRLASAVLSEIGEDWEAEHAYVPVEPRSPASEIPDFQKEGCFTGRRRPLAGGPPPENHAGFGDFHASVPHFGFLGGRIKQTDLQAL